MATARVVRDGEVLAWDALARRRGELFQQGEWVEALGSRATRVGIFDRSGGLIGGFVVSERKRVGLRVRMNAPFCQSAGPFWEPHATSAIGRLEERRAIVDAMAGFLDPQRGITLLGLSRSAVDVLPFRWRGFRGTVEYTYRLPLDRRDDEFLATYDGKARNDVRKARRDGLTVEAGLDLAVMKRLQGDALARDAAGGAECIDGILAFARDRGPAFTVLVRGGSEALAGCLVVGFGETAYYIMGGHVRRGNAGVHHGAGSLALHCAIATAAERGYSVFDFEGSTLRRVEPFIRGFGGTLTPYYRVAKAWLPVECALKLRYREYF